MKAYILLEDGTELEGVSSGAEVSSFGEICFNTGMTGYQEILTDPSYSGQTVVMTYPLIGNYGTNQGDVESDRIQVQGFIIKELCELENNWKSKNKLSEYLIENNIPCVSGVDTRMLTKKIRINGAMNCLITTEKITDRHKELLKEHKFPYDVVKKVSRKEIKTVSTPEDSLNTTKKHKIAVIDLGVKNGIVNQLAKYAKQVDVLPYNADAGMLLNSEYDAILLSNGPGDPQDVCETIQTAKQLIGKIPLFGICLGHQILAIALGAGTYKLKFGHRGSNHPVIDLRTQRVYITAQNHGYAVSLENLPACMDITHINVNDETVEGFQSKEYRIETVQFHPEAGPGPLDANVIFKDWIKTLD